MKKIKFLSKAIRNIGKLSLSDRFLLIFMAVLFVHIFYNLFYHELAGNNNITIDVVARTTMSAIFGYFIGGGFLKVSNSTKIEPKSDLSEADETYPIEDETQENRLAQQHKQQITIVAIIGILALLALIAVDLSVDKLPTEALATVSQLRDFVTASVGLLIGYSDKKGE